MRTVITVVLAAGLAGCGAAPAKRPPAAPTPASTEVPATPAPVPAQLPHRPLRFRSSDGKRLRGILTPAGGKGRAPAVVLVHQLNGSPSQFDPLIGDLHRAGFTTLAYASRSADELDETKLARDVAGAVKALRAMARVDPGRIALTGASIGATTVAYVLGTQPGLRLRGGVGLSAVESPGLIDLASKRRFKPHDLLLIADDREMLNVDNIAKDAGGKGVAKFEAPIPGHGVDLLPDRRVRVKLIGWLKRVT